MKRILNDLILESIRGSVDIRVAEDGINDGDVRRFILEKHYLQAFPKKIKRIYKIYMKQLDNSETCIGCCIFGDAWPQKCLFKLPSNIDDADMEDIRLGKIRIGELQISSHDVFDLKRFYIEPDIKNIESHTLKLCLKKLEFEYPNIKGSTTYSWFKAGHVGGIYQALSAIYLGMNTRTEMFKYVFIFRGVNNRTMTFIKKYFDKPYPKKDKMKLKALDMTDKSIIKLAGMDLSMYKKYHKDLFDQKLSDEQITDYEERVAKSILKVKDHKHMKTMFDTFVYVFSEVLHKRSHIVERAILRKDFSNVTQNDPRRPEISQKWPIMDGVIKYVKEVMGGSWPEFEEKLNGNFFNSVYYTKMRSKSSDEDAILKIIDEPSADSEYNPEVPMI